MKKIGLIFIIVLAASSCFALDDPGASTGSKIGTMAGKGLSWLIAAPFKALGAAADLVSGKKDLAPPGHDLETDPLGRTINDVLIAPPLGAEKIGVYDLTLDDLGRIGHGGDDQFIEHLEQLELQFWSKKIGWEYKGASRAGYFPACKYSNMDENNFMESFKHPRRFVSLVDPQDHSCKYSVSVDLSKDPNKAVAAMYKLDAANTFITVNIEAYDLNIKDAMNLITLKHDSIRPAIFSRLGEVAGFVYNAKTGKAAGVIFDIIHSEIDAGAPVAYLVFGIQPGLSSDAALAAVLGKLHQVRPGPGLKAFFEQVDYCSDYHSNSSRVSDYCSLPAGIRLQLSEAAGNGITESIIPILTSIAAGGEK